MSSSAEIDVGRVLARAGNPAFTYRSFRAAPADDAAAPVPESVANPGASPAATATMPAPAESAAGQFSLLGAALREAAAVSVDASSPRDARPDPAPVPPAAPPTAGPPPVAPPVSTMPPHDPPRDPLPGPFPPRAAPTAAEERRVSLADMFRILAGQPAGSVPGRSEAATRAIARFGAR